MNKLIVALLGAFLWSPVLADKLQFTTSPGAAYAAYVEVHVTDASNHEVFHGFADRFGRINISLPPGTYRVAAKTQLNPNLKATIQITGAQGLRPIGLQ